MSSVLDPTSGDDAKEFETKRINLFAVLDQAEKELGSKIKRTAAADARHVLGGGGGGRTAAQQQHHRGSGGDRSLTKQFRGKDSLFVKPEVPPWRIIEKQKAPDFKLHPHKWTRYSLADVNEMNDKSNAAAAFAFLQEMRTRKSGDDGDNENGDGDRKIVFNRAVAERIKEPPSTAAQPKASFRSSKLIMPEYDFGKKVQRKEKNRPPRATGESSASGKEIKLGHLMMEDEPEDE